MRVKVILEANEEGGFTVLVPGLPGCVVEGATECDALASAREAITMCLAPDDDAIDPGDGGRVWEVVL